MSNNIIEGEFYLNQRKKREKKFKSELNVIEGFSVVSNQQQKQNANKFFIPDGADPGQTVMCEPDKIRYIRLSQMNNFLTIQEVQVFDEKGVNVALAGKYSKNYNLTTGNCRKSTNVGNTHGTPSPTYQGQLTTNKCEQLCNNQQNCSAWEIQSEGSTEGVDPGCWTYNDPSVTGNGDQNTMCRVRQRESNTPIATMSSYFEGTNPFIAINGNISNDQSWPNSASTSTNQGGWWEVDLGRPVNIKKIVVFNRPDGFQERLSGTTMTLIDNQHRTVLSKTLNSNRRQEFDIGKEKMNCGGPVIQKNMDDFQELREIRNKFNKQLQIYNQSITDVLENSRKYVYASNVNNNKFANTWVQDKATSSIGYVTERGVWKWVSGEISGSIQEKMGCPSGSWGALSSSMTPTTADTGQSYNISQAPVGEIVKMSGTELIKGTPMINNQSCRYPGQNVFITEPSTATNPKYTSCSTFVSTQNELNLGDNATFEQCKQRAADKGSNTFALGPNNGNNTSKCYISNNEGNGIVDNSLCSIINGQNNMGGQTSSGDVTYAYYNTSNANNSNLAQSYHINDGLEASFIPNSMIQSGISNTPGKFQLMEGYSSYGNTISQGTITNINDVKQLCMQTKGCTGFQTSGNSYWLKSNGMWPYNNDVRIKDSNYNLYIRIPDISLNTSCNSTINPISQNEFNYNIGAEMTNATQCGLGNISKNEQSAINVQYSKLLKILNEMKQKISELSNMDTKLNTKLLDEFNLLRDRLKKYEQTYSQISSETNISNVDMAMNENSELNMLSNNKQYIIWSIVALGVTFGLTKIMK
jgi:hypothetical protein